MSKNQNSNSSKNDENYNFLLSKEILKPLDLNAILSIDKNDISQENNSPKKTISPKKHTLHSSFNSIIFQNDDFLPVPSTPILKRLSEVEIENKIPPQKKIELKKKPSMLNKLDQEAQSRSEDQALDSTSQNKNTKDNSDYILLELSGQNSLDNIQDHSEESPN